MKLEIWSDIVCPWCYIGKRRVEAALAEFAHRDEVEIVWRSFELDPHAPAQQSGTLVDLLAAKYRVSREQAAAMNARVTSVAAGEGLDYQLDRARPGNSFNAHRLLHLAAAQGRQGELKERLMRAYFTEGRAIGDDDVLIQVAVEAGVAEEDARAVLAGDAYVADVRVDEQRAAALGITGVPFVVLDERYGVSGAQASEVFLKAMQQAWAAARPLAMVGSTSGVGTCDGDECAL